MRRFVIVALGIAVLAACGSPEPSFHGTVLDPSKPVANFTLTDQDGQPFSLDDQQGQVVLLFFGYTHCPDVCPTTLGTWGRVYEALGEDAERVRFVFVTVDPERDTPERLKQHVEIFNEEFVGLTGTPEELDPVYQTFGVYHEKDTATESAVSYLVNHTASTFLVGPDGAWRLKHSYGMPVDDIVHDIKKLLE
jgi:protein SCO1/2